jgi:uncharacterized repeat protein (TIGR03806 family)
MNASIKIWAALLVWFGLVSSLKYEAPESAPSGSASAPATLSSYGFFTGTMASLSPAPQVLPYEVNAPLFSDYAEKARFVYLPEGTAMKYSEDGVFDLPLGAVVIKNFFYWRDARKPADGRKILETRLLVREEKSWKSLVYVWNEEQTEAFLEVAGATFPQSWTDEKGKKQNLEYTVPNLNQCKGCHSFDGAVVPIGMTARQLNRDEAGENQLLAWQKAGKLELPPGFSAEKAPRLTDYRRWHRAQTEVGLEASARAYLDGNCGHCHNPHGPANTSGMFLDAAQTDMARLGLGKPPVAAGRGSGNRKYGIVPGKPAESILLFRMESDDPGIRMPELGRQLKHVEGVELVRAWIKELK